MASGPTHDSSANALAPRRLQKRPGKARRLLSVPHPHAQVGGPRGIVDLHPDTLPSTWGSGIQPIERGGALYRFALRVACRPSFAFPQNRSAGCLCAAQPARRGKSMCLAAQGGKSRKIEYASISRLFSTHLMLFLLPSLLPFSRRHDGCGHLPRFARDATRTEMHGTAAPRTSPYQTSGQRQ